MIMKIIKEKPIKNLNFWTPEMISFRKHEKMHFPKGFKDAPPFFAWARLSNEDTEFKSDTESDRLYQPSPVPRKMRYQNEMVQTEENINEKVLFARVREPILQKNVETSTNSISDPVPTRKTMMQSGWTSPLQLNDLSKEGPIENEFVKKGAEIRDSKEMSGFDVSWPPGVTKRKKFHGTDTMSDNVKYWEWLYWYSSWQLYYSKEQDPTVAKSRMKSRSKSKSNSRYRHRHDLCSAPLKPDAKVSLEASSGYPVQVSSPNQDVVEIQFPMQVNKFPVKPPVSFWVGLDEENENKNKSRQT